MDQSTTIDPIPLRDLWPWALVAAFLIFVLYLVTLDQGAVSRAGLFLHELMHDGRHVLALPCH
jgi:Probable cobalt transporter subunit (CbtB)